MTITIPDPAPLDLSRLAELVLDQGQALADLTARLTVAERRTAAALAAMAAAGVAARLDVVCDVVARAYRAEGMTPPPGLGVTAPARPPLTVLPGGAR